MSAAASSERHYRCLQEAALTVLNTADPDEKATLTFDIYNQFKEGKIPIDDPCGWSTVHAPIVRTEPAKALVAEERRGEVPIEKERSSPAADETAALDTPAHPSINAAAIGTAASPVAGTTSPTTCWYVPAAPARPAWVKQVDPRKTPGAKNLKCLVHALTHAESYAIDLSWDILVRYGYSPATWPLDAAYGTASTPSPLSSLAEKAPRMPDEFFEDWVQVAMEEAKHFSGWRDKLQAGWGAKYGDILAHDGLWESATDTADSLMARLAVVHMVHEARGLDTYLQTHERFQKAGDKDALATIAVNHAEEITHVAAGRRWLQYLCDEQKLDAIGTYQKLVTRFFYGALKPPFNAPSREKAGLTPDWYAALVESSPDTHVDNVVEA